MKRENQPINKAPGGGVKPLPIVIAVIVLIILVVVMVCGHKFADAPAQNGSQVSASVDDFVIKTAYGDLHFPEQWEEYLKVEQAEGDNALTVQFSAKIRDSVIPLFSATIGDETGDIAGTLTAADGTQRTVCIKIGEIPKNDALSASEQQQVYAMQEDLNYLIDHLK